MLMHTMTAARYLTVAHLLEPSVWPAAATLREADVLVDGESLAQQGRVATPSVRIGQAAPQVWGTSPIRQRFVSFVVTRVASVSPGEGHGPVDVVIDADLSGCEPHVSQTRLVGRTPPRRTVRARLRAAAAADGPRLRLPRDIAVGDLLVIPCEGTVTPGEIRCGGAEVQSHDDAAPTCGRHVGAS